MTSWSSRDEKHRVKQSRENRICRKLRAVPTSNRAYTFLVARVRGRGCGASARASGLLCRCAPLERTNDWMNRVGRVARSPCSSEVDLAPVFIQPWKFSEFLFVKPAVADEDAERRCPRNVESRKSVQKTATHDVRPKKAPAGPENCSGKGKSLLRKNCCRSCSGRRR